MLTEPILVTLQVVEALDKLNIPYFITGSLATATHGVARSTMDVDMLVDLQLKEVEPFERYLEGAFFVDVQMMRKAIRQGRSFNIIHKETVFKVDFFPIKNSPFDQVQLSRRIALSLTGNPDQKAYVSSPEDNILAKLAWYRKGGEVSDRQWGDVINVIKIQGDSLDRKYLRKWALHLSVEDLLAKALLEVE
ncbi:MAG: hypothetical protein MAG431_00379 [Chloroflexi bacterium]|nr:hypothetical protein [Chloroflexota bacterium]